MPFPRALGPGWLCVITHQAKDLHVRISVFGLGYVGAVSCGCLPELGHTVIGVDTNALKVKMVNEGKLRATHDVEDAILNSDVSLISVATPSNPNYTPNLTAVDAVVRQIGEVLRKKEGAHVIVLRSTVQPGTT